MPRATVGKLKSSGRRFDEPPNNPSYFTVVSEPRTVRITVATRSSR
jgi:hypothetical protein